MSEPSAQVPSVHTFGNPPSSLHEQFEELEQQRDAAEFGMWVFIATEMLFFGGVFTCYIVFRSEYLPGFEAGSRLLDAKLGALMTGVLLVSSFTMAMAVHSAQSGRRRATVLFLVLTIILGTAFLGMKFSEYAEKRSEHLLPGFDFHPTTEMLRGAPPQSVEMLIWLYFAMTGLHALHMIIGIGLLAVIAFLSWRGKYSPQHYTPIEVSGLYWHFVDIIWIFLFPLLYLIGGRY